MNGTKTGSSHCKVSSVTLMRRLSSNSRKNQIYKAFREVGRVMRTVALPAGLIANTVAAMLWAWSTCPECRDRRWTG